MSDISEEEGSSTIVEIKKALFSEVCQTEGKFALPQLRSKRVSINYSPVNSMQMVISKN